MEYLIGSMIGWHLAGGVGLILMVTLLAVSNANQNLGGKQSE